MVYSAAETLPVVGREEANSDVELVIKAVVVMELMVDMDMAMVED